MFKHRLLRDLSWVILSPPMVSGKMVSEIHDDVYWWDHQSCINEHLACLPALKELDNNPQPLVSFIAALKTKGLGHYFEALVYFWFKISPNYNILANNIQIIIGGRTLGEIDFIIQDIRSKKVIHLEVAVKFYLGSPPYHNSFSWYGTNTEDQLGKKIQHLREKQTQLSEQHKAYLFNKLGLKIDHKHCLLKGRLFYPPNNNESPDIVTSNHLRGRWLHYEDNTSLEDRLYYPLDKSQWLSPLNHHDINTQQLEKRPKENKWPRCYSEVEKCKNGNFGNYQEINRVFLLPRRLSEN